MFDPRFATLDTTDGDIDTIKQELVILLVNLGTYSCPNVRIS